MMMPRSPSSSGSRLLMSAAASRRTLKLPIRLTSITPEGVKRHWAIASDDPARGADTGAIDHDAGGTVALARCSDRRFDRAGVGHIGGNREPAGLAGRLDGGRLVDVEDRDPHSGSCERLCRRPPQTRGAATDNCRLSFDLHMNAEVTPARVS